MNRRGLVVGFVLLAQLMMAESILAQNSPRPLSLADRLAELRKGWGGRDREDEKEPRPRTATSAQPLGPASGATTEPRQLAIQPRPTMTATGAAASASARPYPRVNARQLLPNDYSHLRRRNTDAAEKVNPPAEPSEPSEPATRTAALPNPLVGETSAPASTPQSLGDAYLAAPSAAPVKTTKPQATTEAAANPFSQISQGTSPASRPSPTVRRSPRWTPPADFDPDELRRDLVDTSGRPLVSDDTTDDVVETSEVPSTSPQEPAANDAISSTAPVQLGPPESTEVALEPVESDAPTWTTDDSTPATADWETMPGARAIEPDSSLSGTGIESYGAAPVAEDSTTGTNAFADGVRSAGEQAFAEDSNPEAFTPDEGNDYFPSTTAAGPSDAQTPSAATRGRESFFANQPASPIGDNVLVSNRMPMISSHVSGPRQILIGREAHYKLRLSNQSETPAEQVVAQVRVPEWADVIDTAASSGIIQVSSEATEPNTYRWQLNRLAAQGNETLDIKLIPRSSRPLELEVDWSYAPVGARAVVEVQEPKLRMVVTGPDEVLYGTPQLYRLSLSNPGTGVAENVQIHLLPPGGGEETVSSHFVGELPPGGSKVVEVELTAREAGKLYVKASATAEGDISADGEKEIFCRKPELEVDWRGPEQKYAGTAATYFFRVRNPGTAAANDVTVGVRLPEGAEFLSASEGQVYDPDQSTVLWRVGSLRPGDDYYMELKCLVNKPGANKFDIKAVAAESDLVDVKSAEMNVVALADLKLEVMDPKGPVPVGQEAVYEIRVRNRGMNTAEEVNVVALFSEGIDAESVEGAQYSISDGRVTFRTIEKLPAGREIVLRIRARAKMPGTHIFRAEVLCRDLEIKLAAEETTRFYQDDSAGSTSGSTADSALRSEAFQDESGSRY